MLSTAQLEQRRAAGRSRAKAFDTAYQQAARANVRTESLTASAKAGNAACVKKYGPAVNARRAAKWRASRPTRLAQTVCGWLDSAFVPFQIEVELVPGKAYGDILVTGADHRPLDVECDGRYFHELPGRAQHDAARDDKVRAAGYTVLRLAEADIASGAAKEVLSKVLGISL